MTPNQNADFDAAVEALKKLTLEDKLAAYQTASQEDWAAFNIELHGNEIPPEDHWLYAAAQEAGLTDRVDPQLHEDDQGVVTLICPMNNPDAEDNMRAAGFALTHNLDFELWPSRTNRELIAWGIDFVFRGYPVGFQKKSRETAAM